MSKETGFTLGVGGSTQEAELFTLAELAKTRFSKTPAIEASEFQARIQRAQALMKKEGLAAIYLNAGTNLYYFTGTKWYASERLVGAILPAEGDLEYIAPQFELDTLQDYMVIKAPVACWEEHECPYQLVAQRLANQGIVGGQVGMDEATAFFISNGIVQATPSLHWQDAKPITAGCRMHKSLQEIALLQQAKDMTLEVHKSAARILNDGISTTEVEAFIHQAHKAIGAPSGSYFCIVLFGEATAYPHGVKDPQNLQNGDMVLIDTGCQIQGYNSDITRTYVYGVPTERQRQVWNAEKAAQATAFEAAQLGQACHTVDDAARQYLATVGFGPEYKLPGLPHRTGHGVGLDIHEWPYLVGSDKTQLAEGMCFSNEPMICIPGEFGIRLEDHFYMTHEGPKWFTEPSLSVDDPFGYEA